MRSQQIKTNNIHLVSKKRTLADITQLEGEFEGLSIDAKETRKRRKLPAAASQSKFSVIANKGDDAWSNFSSQLKFTNQPPCFTKENLPFISKEGKSKNFVPVNPNFLCNKVEH